MYSGNTFVVFEPAGLEDPLRVDRSNVWGDDVIQGNYLGDSGFF